MFKVNYKNTVTTSLPPFCFFLLLTLNICYAFSSVSIVDFKQVNVIWETDNEGI